MAWAGTGAACVRQGGVLNAQARDGAMLKENFTFARISGSPIGFSKAANPDVTATLRAAIGTNALPAAPEFIPHTGELSQLSKEDEFDTLEQCLKSVRADRIFYVPAEHDILDDTGAKYRERYAKESKGNGWHSFDYKGVHFTSAGCERSIHVHVCRRGNICISAPSTRS